MTFGLALVPATASADLLTFTGTGSLTGLSATADFTLVNATTLKIVLTNTSTSLPPSLQDSNASANQLLTTLAFQLPGATSITGGSIKVKHSNMAPDGDLNTEWGYGWTGGGQCCAVPSGQGLDDWISTNSSGTTQFAPGSIDSSGLNGPSFGIAPLGADTGGLEAISYSAIFTLSLSGPVPDLSFLSNGAVVEYGSDAAFLDTSQLTPGAPEPGLMALLALGLAGMYRQRRARA